jgi:hypothetical protein
MMTEVFLPELRTEDRELLVDFAASGTADGTRTAEMLEETGSQGRR